MNKPIYLDLSILEISKTLMYDYIKSKYQYNTELCYINADSFIMHIRSEDVYKDIAKYARKRFDISNYAMERPLPKGKNKM